MKPDFLMVTCFWLCADAAISKIHLKHPIKTRQRYDRLSQLESIDYETIRPQILKQALDYLNRNNIKAYYLKKCLHNHDGKNIADCMKGLLRSSYKSYDLSNVENRFNKYSSEDDEEYPDFVDFTRFGRSGHERQNFSKDYLDVNDLLRHKNKNIKSHMLKVVRPNRNKYDRFNYDLTGLRRFNSDDSDDEKAFRENSQSASDSEEVKPAKKETRTYDDSDESSSEEEEPRKVYERDPSVFYMQSASRLFGADARRRLPHFFPKRLHWDEDEMKELTNYWFNGPLGKYWGYYKTPY